MIKMKLSWNRSFFKRKAKRFEEAQKFVDEQCVEKMSEFVPVASSIYENSGALRDSVKIEEPGKIIYTASFAEHQYYDELNHQNSGNPYAKRLWFEVMKNKYLDEIRDGTGKILGKK